MISSSMSSWLRLRMVSAARELALVALAVGEVVLVLVLVLAPAELFPLVNEHPAIRSVIAAVVTAAAAVGVEF